MVWIYIINEINMDYNKRLENMLFMFMIICFSYYIIDVVLFKVMIKIL